MKNKKSRKILVAMSGGVDSSVVAALLVSEGYDVTGAYMKQWDDKDDTGVCTWKEDRRDALRVAAHLGIPMITLDFEREYKKWVMEYMYAEYEKGRTPNPDVMCNKFIKFGVWLDKAKELGFSKLATGHYAALRAENANSKSETLKINLLQARDRDKDQTYFLHQLNQNQLEDVLFPLGVYTKSQVRALAKKYNLPTADRPESMGICFVGEVPMKEFLLKKIKPKKGDIVNAQGEVLGSHDGLAFYTIGQRHGFGDLVKNKGEKTEALYVVDKNEKENKLVVGCQNDPLMYKKEAKIVDINWVSGSPFASFYAKAMKDRKATGDRQDNSGQIDKSSLECKVRLRHRQKLQNVQISQKNGNIFIYFKKKQKAVTPGQFAVFYKGSVCLGGGVIADI